MVSWCGVAPPPWDNLSNPPFLAYYKVVNVHLTLPKIYDRGVDRGCHLFCCGTNPNKAYNYCSTLKTMSIPDYRSSTWDKLCTSAPQREAGGIPLIRKFYVHITINIRNTEEAVRGSQYSPSRLGYYTDQGP